MSGARARAAMCARGADRRAGAGDDVPPRIVGAHDEAERFCGSGKGGSCLLRQADDHERSARRGAHPVRACRLCGFGQSLKRHRIGMAEGEADAIGERIVAQEMQADGAFCFIPAQPGMSRSEEEVFDGGAEYADALGRNNVARARVATSSRNDFEQARGDFDAVSMAT